MILGGTPFIRTSYFVAGNVVPVSFRPVVFAPHGFLGNLFSRLFFPVHKLDYHGPEEGEHDDHH